MTERQLEEGTMSCVACHRPFDEGEQLHQRLVGFKTVGAQVIPQVEVVCAMCALGIED